jgi:hypothetical protein
MDINNKQKIIEERISQIDFHISLLTSNIENGYTNKENLVSFEQLLNDFISKKEALQGYLDDLE